MKILITGASGFVGTHLVEAAIAKGIKVHAAVRKSSNISSLEGLVDKFIYTDQSDYKELFSLLSDEQYDYIVHAAALTKAKKTGDFHAVNVKNTEVLLDAAFSLPTPPKRVVFVSSLAALGPVEYDTVDEIAEDSAYKPITEYGRSKRDAELMIKEKFSDKPISVFRPTAVYGPREKDLFILFDTLNKGLDPYIGKKPQKLSFVYVKDLANVLLLGCTVEQQALQFYNISDGFSYSRFAMAEVFRESFSKKPFRIFVPLFVISVIAKISEMVYKYSDKIPTIYPERLGELTAANWVCSIEKAKKALGYNPVYDLKKGLKETLFWYKQNGWLK